VPWEVGSYKSPWKNSDKECEWPVDYDVGYLCSVPGRYGHGTCPVGSTCGSGYDEFGHPRFVASSPLDRARDVYEEDLDWGFNQFPNFLEASITIFQCITLEGWTGIMYRVMDAYDPVLAVVYFIVLVIFGAFCVVNLVLSVLWDSFVNNQREKIERIYTELFEELDNEDNHRDGFFPAHRVFRIKAYVQAVAEQRLVLALRHMFGDQTSTSVEILKINLTREEFVTISREVLGDHRSTGLSIISKRHGGGGGSPGGGSPNRGSFARRQHQLSPQTRPRGTSCAASRQEIRTAVGDHETKEVEVSASLPPRATRIILISFLPSLSNGPKGNQRLTSQINHPALPTTIPTVRAVPCASGVCLSSPCPAWCQSSATSGSSEWSWG
jgi:hypothetical protein